MISCQFKSERNEPLFSIDLQTVPVVGDLVTYTSPQGNVLNYRVIRRAVNIFDFRGANKITWTITLEFIV